LGEFKNRPGTFAGRLQEAMDIRGMKKADLSRQTGINQQRIGQYILGRYEAKQSAVYVIAKALGVDPAWLMGYDLPMAEPPIDPKKPKIRHKITNEDLKLALFGTAAVSNNLLEDVKNMAKVHLELSKKKKFDPA